MAERMHGMLQKMREAVANTASYVSLLVAMNADQATQIKQLKAITADMQAKLTEFVGATIVTSAEFDEISNMVAAFQILERVRRCRYF